MVGRQLLLWASENEWLESQLTRRAFARRAVKRFMPGETVEEALRAAKTLADGGMSTILTRLGENVEDAAAAEDVERHYLAVVGQIEEQGLDTDISVKPTQFGLDLDFDQALERMKRVVQRAAMMKRLVAIDMESSEYVDRTIELYRKLRAGHSNVAICLQSYLHRTAADLASLLPLAPTIRLVKGAYMESPEIAYRRKTDVDANFLRLSDTLLNEVKKGNARVFIGTHDMKVIDGARERAHAIGLPRDGFEIQMLYGIQREAQTRLTADGYKVRVLISYGESWFPWYMRRLAERPANVLFLARNLIAR
jgi:proline dehydrogenase